MDTDEEESSIAELMDAVLTIQSRDSEVTPFFQLKASISFPRSASYQVINSHAKVAFITRSTSYENEEMFSSLVMSYVNSTHCLKLYY